jgi:molybdate transport system ATP-binding protein
MLDLSFKKSLHSVDGNIVLEAAVTMEAGTTVALYGGSGAGKTTVLRIVAGLERPEEGFVRWKNETWFDSQTGIFVKPQRRAAALVFQNYALFPNMSVRENLQFAQGRDNKDSQLINELLNLSQLEGLENRMPEKLSGGQQQRVALARALARRPDILLLDEPLSAVDNDLRIELQSQLKTMQHRFGLTMVLVSHDLSEIFGLANRVLILEKGEVIRSGAPDEVFSLQGISEKFRVPCKVVSFSVNEERTVIKLLVCGIVQELDMPNKGLPDLSPGKQMLLVLSEGQIRLEGLDRF